MPRTCSGEREISAGLGVKLVLAVGTQHQVDTQLREEGRDPLYVGGYRVYLLPDSKPSCVVSRLAGKLIMHI